MRRASIQLFVLLIAVAPAAAQQPAPDLVGRRIHAEATAHAEAGRHALAAESFMTLHARMLERGNGRAPLALWNAGYEWSQVPGHERDARATLQRFVDDSNALAVDADVADLRSRAFARIAELDARIGPTTDSPSIVGPIVMAVGGAAVVAGLILGGISFARNAELDAMCPGGVCIESDETRSRQSEIAAMSNAADALWIGGAVVAGVGLILTFVLRESAAPPVTACGPRGCEWRWTF